MSRFIAAFLPSPRPRSLLAMDEHQRVREGIFVPIPDRSGAVADPRISSKAMPCTFSLEKRSAYPVVHGSRYYSNRLRRFGLFSEDQ